MKGLLILVNYNQAQEIAAFLDALEAVDHPLDIVLVDDGSTDGSPEIAEARGLPVIRHSKNFGVGKAIRSGIRHARESNYDYVVIMSSNGKMHPTDLPVVIAPIIEDTADYVQGSRFARGGRSLSLSAFRRLTIPLYSLVSSAILGRRFTDITCGFRAYRISLLNDPRIDLDQEWLDRYEAELYIHYYACKVGARVIEVPVTIDYSRLAADRKSKMRPFAGWWSLARPFLLLATGLRR